MATDISPNRLTTTGRTRQHENLGETSPAATVVNQKSPLAMVKLLLSTGLIRFLSSSGTILLSVVLARTMSKEQFGIYSFCMVVLISLSMTARYGLDAVMLRYAGSAWHEGDRKRFRGYSFWATSLTTKHSVCFAILGLLILWLVGFNNWSKAPVMGWMLVALFPWSMLYTISFIFKSAHRAPTGSVFEVGTINHLTWITVLILVYGFHLQMTAASVAIIVPICASVVCAAGLWMLHRNGIWPEKTELIEEDRPGFIDACRSNTAIYIMQMLANLGGIFFLGLAWNDEEVATFSAPCRLANATILLTTIVMLVIAPRLSGLHKAGETERFKRTLRFGCLTVAAVNLPILLSLAVFAPWIMLLMPKYADHWYLLSIICVGQAIGIVAGLAPTVMTMTGHDRLWSRAVVASAGCCITLCAVLSYFFGAVGAAIGAASYQASLNWVAAFMVRAKLGFWTIPRPIKTFRQWRSSTAAA